MKNITIKQKMFSILVKFTGLMAVFLILFPIVWLIRTSLIPTVYLFDIPPPLFVKPTLAAYHRVFYTQNLAMRMFTSLMVASASTFIAVAVGSMAAYAVTRFYMPFSKNLPFAFLFLRMMPSVAVLMPIFLMFSKMRLLDTYIGLICTYTTIAIPTVIWMMWGFLRDLPKEIEESAYIDGSGYFNTFVKIVLPITLPAVASVAILSFTSAWNEYMMASILTRTKVATLPPAVVALMVRTELAWDNVTAGGVVLALPIIVLSICAQKYFVQGLSAGAVKG